jgi:hypothetical protein
MIEYPNNVPAPRMEYKMKSEKKALPVRAPGTALYQRRVLHV